MLRIVPGTQGQAGAAYSTTPVALGAGDTFSTAFQFRFTNTGGIDPADGITFVLAASPNGLGGPGGGLGYQSGVPNSVAVEFDTYNNGFSDAESSNHIAIDTNGILNDSNAVYSPTACRPAIFPPATPGSGACRTATNGRCGSAMTAAT